MMNGLRLIGFVLTVLLVVGCGSESSSPSAAGDTTTATSSTEKDSAPGELLSVDVDSLGTNHVEPPVSYPNSPSIGGDHYPFWQNCGFYDVSVLEGAATHTLEHGAVWITYNPELLDEAEIDELRALADSNGKLLISPYDQPESLILSAWGVQLRTSFDPTAPGVADFIETWVDNPELSEAGVRCTGAAGIPPTDVRTLADGTQVPENYG